MNNLVDVLCDLCGSGMHRKIREKNGLKVVKCKKCNLAFVNPQLRREELVSMYNENKISPVDYYLETEEDDALTFKRRLRLLSRFLPEAAKLEVLDLGCNIGTFSLLMKKKGWLVKGIDVNESAIEYCRRHNDVDAACADFLTVDLQRNKYNLVVMNDFLEHVQSPAEALTKTFDLLKKGGRVFISTPTIDSMVAFVSGNKWLHLKPDEHLFYFSKKTISALLIKSRFEIEWLGSLGRIRNLKQVFYKSQVYTPWLWKLVEFLHLEKGLAKVRLNVNLGDEMGVLAVKPDR